jgi:hypothetical protein
MADAATPGAPAASQGQAAPANATPGAKLGETPAQAAARLKLDLGDGEREYDLEHVKGLAQRGKKAAQTLSLAEKRAQDAQKREEETKSFRSRFESKDAKQIRAALKELGVDERLLANEVGRDLLEEMELTPEQKKVKALEQQLRQRDEESEKGKREQQAKAEAEETERHKEELAELFTTVMEKAALPRESAAAVFPRLANLYAAVEGSGGKVDPDLAAERIKSTIQAEHRALYYKPDGKGGQTLNVEAMEAMLGPEAMREIRQHAVNKYRQQKAAGGAAPPPPAQRQQAQEPEQPRRGGSFWKELDKRLKG